MYVQGIDAETSLAFRVRLPDFKPDKIRRYSDVSPGGGLGIWAGMARPKTRKKARSRDEADTSSILTGDKQSGVENSEKC